MRLSKSNEIGPGNLSLPMPVTRGLLFYAPFVRHRKIYSIANKRQMQALSTETVDADGTYVGHDGLVHTATANVGHIDHDPVIKRPLGLLCEGARTNLCLRSAEYDHATWTKIRTTASANAATSPDGTASGDKIIPSTADNTHDVRQVIVTFNGSSAYCHSVYAKAAGYDWIQMTLPGAQFVGSPGQYFDVSNGVAGTGAAVDSVGIEDAGGGWYRCWMIATSDAAADGTVIVRVATADETNSFVGDETSGVYLWGSQVEIGAFPSSCIPTTTAAVARSADNFQIDNTGEVHCEAAAGTVLCAVTLQRGTGTEGVLGSGASVADEILLSTNSGVPRFRVRSGSANVALIDATNTITVGVPAVIAACWQVNDFRLYVDGGDEQTDSAGAAPTAMPTALHLGVFRTGSGEYLYGEMSHLLIYNRAFSAGEIKHMYRWIKGEIGA